MEAVFRGLRCASDGSTPADGHFWRVSDQPCLLGALAAPYLLPPRLGPGRWGPWPVFCLKNAAGASIYYGPCRSMIE
jgi:hypothetical protein